jgi:hypothetical protein
METLYDLQMATIKAGGQNLPGLLKQFKDIREALYQYWNSISKVLKKGNSFACEVVRLQDLHRTSDQAEIVPLLQELIEKGETCKEESHRLVEKHKVAMQHYSSTKASFITSLRNPANTDEKRRPHESPPLIDEGAIPRFGKALEDLWKDTENMDRFFEGQLATCRRFLDAAQGRNRDVSMDESQQFANQWTGYQVMLFKTYLKVCAICDAVTASPGIA